MSHGIGHADRSPLRNSEQDERLPQIGRLDHGLQILDPTIEGEVADVQVSHPAPALVVAYEAEVFAEEANPVPPDQALPFVFEVGQPVRGLYQHEPRTRLCPGELYCVRSAHIPDSLSGLLHDRTHFPRPNGPNVLWEWPEVYPNRDETPIAWQRRKPHPTRHERGSRYKKSAIMEEMPCSNESYSLPTGVSAT